MKAGAVVLVLGLVGCGSDGSRRGRTVRQSIARTPTALRGLPVCAEVGSTHTGTVTSAMVRFACDLQVA